MKKKFAIIVTVALLICTHVLFLTSASAGLQASPVFNTKSVALSSTMTATMTCTTSVDCKKIYVSAVRLERLSNGSWVKDQDLPCPTATATNDNSFGTSKAYASYCTKGNTYRIVVTFNGDGVTASATSVSVAYK